jgi:precorrin-6Y C5,15-methyltransferase (decarboxylating)
VEKNPQRIGQIHTNRRRFGIGNMQVVQAHLPEGLTDLPDPDRIFIGGGGKKLGDIVITAAGRLKPAGIIVINTVLVGNMTTAVNQLESLGLEMEMIQIQVNRAKTMPFSHRLEAINPVWIITGRRP